MSGGLYNDLRMSRAQGQLSWPMQKTPLPYRGGLRNKIAPHRQQWVRIAFPSWALNCSEATPESTLPSNAGAAISARETPVRFSEAAE